MARTRTITVNLEPVAPECPDPGNPGQVLQLLGAPAHTTARWLRCWDATPNADGTRDRYLIPVPDDTPDPLSAAAWTFGVTPTEYSRLRYAA